MLDTFLAQFLTYFIHTSTEHKASIQLEALMY